MLMTPRSHGHTQGREGRFLEEPCMCSKRLGARIQLEQRRTRTMRLGHPTTTVSTDVLASERAVLLRARVRQRPRVERSPARAALAMLRVRTSRTPLRALEGERTRRHKQRCRDTRLSHSKQRTRPSSEYASTESRSTQKRGAKVLHTPHSKDETAAEASNPGDRGLCGSQRLQRADRNVSR